MTGLSQAYYAQRQALGSRWFSRGVADLKVKNFAAAVVEFRTALLYSRDDYNYQLNLAEALIGLRHTGEASAYLLNLSDREPEDGLVNLELARIAAQQGDTKQAVRHYHDAVYAAWPRDQDAQRRDARFELIQLFLRMTPKTQAQAELIGLGKTSATTQRSSSGLANCSCARRISSTHWLPTEWLCETILKTQPPLQVRGTPRLSFIVTAEARKVICNRQWRRTRKIRRAPNCFRQRTWCCAWTRSDVELPPASEAGLCSKPTR